MINSHTLQELINELKSTQDDFYKTFGITDIITNSKIFEIMIANSLNHKLLPKLSGSRDAKDDTGYQYEYKHYKETSSNHSWTFNDYSDSTIEKIKQATLIFAHIDDTIFPPIFDWYYKIPGEIISKYLSIKTKPIKNKRKMINVSPRQIEKEMQIERQTIALEKHKGEYNLYIDKMFDIASKIEELVGTKNILTSNKFWELLIASIMGHKVLAEQKAYDAIDDDGNHYEYKVARAESWSFEDISDRVLEKFDNIKAVLLAKVNKKKFNIQKLYLAEPSLIVKDLKRKLIEKSKRYQAKGKEVRRLQISLSKNDILKIGAKIIYPK